MARNRKKNTNSVNIKMIFGAATLIITLGALAFFYVHQKNRTVFLGTEIKRLEHQIAVASEKNNVLVSTVANLKNSRNVNFKNVQWQLGLVQPDDSQFVRLGSDARQKTLRVASSQGSSAREARQDQ